MKKLILLVSLLSVNNLLAESPALESAAAQTDKTVKTATPTPMAAPQMASPSFDQERWKKLMTLIDSEIKTIKNNRYSGPELKHRMFELYSEKIKLIKEKENLNLLKADAKAVLKNGKESFFSASQNQ